MSDKELEKSIGDEGFIAPETGDIEPEMDEEFKKKIEQLYNEPEKQSAIDNRKKRLSYIEKLKEEIKDPENEFIVTANIDIKNECYELENGAKEAKAKASQKLNEEAGVKIVYGDRGSERLIVQTGEGKEVIISEPYNFFGLKANPEETKQKMLKEADYYVKANADSKLGFQKSAAEDMQKSYIKQIEAFDSMSEETKKAVQNYYRWEADPLGYGLDTYHSNGLITDKQYDRIKASSGDENKTVSNGTVLSDGIKKFGILNVLLLNRLHTAYWLVTNKQEVDEQSA